MEEGGGRITNKMEGEREGFNFNLGLGKMYTFADS